MDFILFTIGSVIHDPIHRRLQQSYGQHLREQLRKKNKDYSTLFTSS